MIGLMRSSFVIARRDFAATVLSKAFIFFLLGPLFPLLLGGVFGGIGARVAAQTDHSRVAVIATPADFAAIHAAREQMAQAIGGEAVVDFVRIPPNRDPMQEQTVLRVQPVRAVLGGGLAAPHLTGALGENDPLVGQLRLLIADARNPRAAPRPLPVRQVAAETGGMAKDRALTAQIGQMLLFFLTILLSGMVLSQLIEEKSNKIIEVIAAAVPIDAMFIGKLFAMLAASVVGIAFWIGGGALLVQLVKQGGVATLPPPAVGWPAFLLLGIVYFAMNYLLLGAVFLTIGAQASTAREVQTMSMPVTFGQVLIFGLAATAIGNTAAPEAVAAAVFPLSSPMVMMAWAAERQSLWPHLIAIAWQALWVALIIWTGARLFRKTVLKSGPRSKWWRFGRASA